VVKKKSLFSNVLVFRWAVACLFFCFSFSMVCPLRAQSFGPRTSSLQTPFTNTITGLNASKKQGLAGSKMETGPSGRGGPPTDMSVMEYQVHVLGQVNQPGTYRIGPSVRLAEVVNIAGGISPLGSKRKIELRQEGGRTRSIDLFQFTRDGNLGENPFMQDNDVVFVPFIANSVRIEGPVKGVGTYELMGEKTVWDVIELAGGYSTGNAEKEKIVIIRYGGDGKKELAQISNVPMELQQIPVQNGDIIIVPHIFTKDRKFDYTVDQLPSDNVFYPSYNNNIFVVGAVTNQGPIDYNPNLSVVEYVNLAGPTPLAKIQRIRVMTARGKIIRNVKKYNLSPGDTVVVPERKVTTANVLSWYSTFASTVFTGVALKSLIE